MNWISVKDKLPEDFSIPDEFNQVEMCIHDYVFVCGDNKQEGTVFSIAQRREGEIRNTYVWEILEGTNRGAYDCSYFADLKPEHITHWAKFIYPKENYAMNIKRFGKRLVAWLRSE